MGGAASRESGNCVWLVRSEWAGDGRSFVGSGRGFEREPIRYWELLSQVGTDYRASPGEWLAPGANGNSSGERRVSAGSLEVS